MKNLRIQPHSKAMYFLCMPQVVRPQEVKDVNLWTLQGRLLTSKENYDTWSIGKFKNGKLKYLNKQTGMFKEHYGMFPFKKNCKHE